METLKSMTDFVLEQDNTDYLDSEKLRVIKNYAKFLKQPLTLGMFVPCDEDGNVCKYPPTEEERLWAEKDSQDDENSYKDKVKSYEKAKNKVLFEGFNLCVVNGDNAVHKIGKASICESEMYDKTVEFLQWYNPILTETAKKQIGL